MYNVDMAAYYSKLDRMRQIIHDRQSSHDAYFTPSYNNNPFYELAPSNNDPKAQQIQQISGEMKENKTESKFEPPTKSKYSSRSSVYDSKENRSGSFK